VQSEAEICAKCAQTASKMFFRHDRNFDRHHPNQPDQLEPTLQSSGTTPAKHHFKFSLAAAVD